eukprot:9236305-Pyramimonas_sp.AAC.1
MGKSARRAVDGWFGDWHRPCGHPGARADSCWMGVTSQWQATASGQELAGGRGSSSDIAEDELFMIRMMWAGLTGLVADGAPGVASAKRYL